MIMENFDFNPIQKRCKIKEKLLNIVISEGLNVSKAQSIFEECARTTNHMYMMFYLTKLLQENND